MRGRMGGPRREVPTRERGDEVFINSLINY